MKTTGILKKVFSWICFAIAILAFLLDVLLGVEGVLWYDQLSADPATSGIDFLGLYILPSLMLIPTVAGILAAAIGANLTEKKIVRYISFSLCALFVLGICMVLAAAMLL